MLFTMRDALSETPVPGVVPEQFPEILLLEGMLSRRGSSKGLDRADSVEGQWGRKGPMPSPARGMSQGMGPGMGEHLLRMVLLCRAWWGLAAGSGPCCCAACLGVAPEHAAVAVVACVQVLCMHWHALCAAGSSLACVPCADVARHLRLLQAA
jgi:hypothetical protein